MTILLDFVLSAIILLALISVYEAATSNIKFTNRGLETVVCGVAIGLITIAILSNPVNVSKGIFVDARWVLLSCAAIFLNWRIVVIGGVIGATYRYLQGGAGAVPGVYTVMVAIAIGFLWRYMLLRTKIEFKWYLHYVFALLIELSILGLLYVVLPDGKGPIVVGIIMQPLLLVFPIVSLVLSLLLQHHWNEQVVAFTEGEADRPQATTKIRTTAIRSLILSVLIIASLITLSLMQYTNSSELLAGERNRLGAIKMADEVKSTVQVQSRMFNSLLSGSEPENLERFLTAIEKRKASPLTTIVSEEKLASAHGVRDVIELGNREKVSPEEYDILLEIEGSIEVLSEIETKAVSQLSGQQFSAALETFNSDEYASILSNVLVLADAFAAAVGERTNLETARLEAKEAQLFRNFGILLFIIVAATFFEFLWGTKKFVGPIESLTDFARQVANGDYSKRANIESNNEIGELAATFNEMADSIEEDIAEREKTAAEIEGLRKQAEERSKELEVALNLAELATEAKGEFLASMSHEIRTPMNGVLGMADLLSQTNLNDDQKQMLNTIRDSGDALLTIINDILDFSKIEAGKMNIEKIPFSLTDVVEGASATISPTASQKKIRISAFVDPNIPDELIGDPVRLRQIVFNLTGNAVKFSDEGEVVVRADRISGDEKSSMIRISVIDHGIGISEEAQTKLFEAFSQADSSTTRRFGGTGLGLSICKNLMDMMGGRISVESRIGLGSTFFIELSLDHNPDAKEPASEFDLKDVHVLGISESEVTRLIIQQYVEASGGEASVAASPAELAELLADNAALLNTVNVVAFDAVQETDLAMEAYDLGQFTNAKTIQLNDGQRRSARIEDGQLLSLDANPIRQMALLNAIAVAVGRASPLVKSEDEDLGNVVVPTIEEARSQGTLILLAEDNVTNQKVIQRQLGKLGYACEIAADGELALEAWRDRDFGLLLTDCHMPNMDGYQLTGAVRADEEKTGIRKPIIAVTANALEGEAEKCLAAGMDDYLSKPLAMKDLREKLRKWLPHHDFVLSNEIEIEATDPAASVSGHEPVTSSQTPPVDPSGLKDIFGDDDEAILEILKEFIEPSTENVGEILAAYEERNADGVGKASHKLKSSSRSIGAHTLADLCADLEKAGKTEDWEAIDAKITGLQNALDTVVEHISAL